MRSKTLIYDIENMAAIAWVWENYQTDPIKIIKQQHLLCIAYKWLGEKKVRTIALPDFKLYKTDKHNDRELAKAFWEVINQADVVVGHNSNSFDNKMVTSMFMRHKLPPPEPYHTVDTKQAAKQNGRFISNKLDDLGEVFEIGKKRHTGGFGLWEACDKGDMKAWKKMLAYNKQDVLLTEKLYLELRPWIKSHPALNVLEKRPESCPKCLSTKVYAGMKYKATNTNLYQYFRCQNCGGMMKSRIPEYKQAMEKMVYVS